MSSIQRHGLFAGLIEAIFFGGFVWLIIWPIWLLSEGDAVTSRLRVTPSWLLALAWPLGILLIWFLDPDHGLVAHAGPWRLVALPVVWALIVLLPVFTLRALKLWRAERLVARP